MQAEGISLSTDIYSYRKFIEQSETWLKTNKTEAGLLYWDIYVPWMWK